MQHLIIIADILLHVAGLAVVTDGIPNDSGVKIILPRVEYVDFEPITAQANPGILGTLGTLGNSTTPPTTGSSTPTPAPAAPPTPPPPVRLSTTSSNSFAQRRGAAQHHVQDHKATLLFRKENLINAVNWPVVDLTGVDAGWSYVVLDGDYIRLDPNAVNPAAEMTAVRLPHLRNKCCPQLQTLKREFVAPYQGAAAVFDIGQGQLTSCETAVRNGTRRDSELLLANTSGMLIVSADTMTSSKNLRFRTPPGKRIELIAANLPAAYLAGNYRVPNTNDADGRPHFFAYYDMGNQGGACNLSLQACAYKSPPDPVPGNCMATQFVTYAKKLASPTPDAMPDGVLAKVMASNFECSNSSWP